MHLITGTAAASHHHRHDHRTSRNGHIANMPALRHQPAQQPLQQVQLRFPLRPACPHPTWGALRIGLSAGAAAAPDGTHRRCAAPQLESTSGLGRRPGRC